MKNIGIIINLILACSTISAGQYPYKYFEKGDTLTVFTPNGISLRENPDYQSKRVDILPFKEKLIVTSNHYEKYDEFENRQGGWIGVKYNGNQGFVFSGYLTDKKIPAFKKEKHKCLRAAGFLAFFQLNLEDTIVQGIDSLPCFGKYGPIIKDWILFSNGDEIIFDLAYESMDIIVESYHFTMNDVINYLETYITLNCEQDFNSFKIKTSKGELGFIDELNCEQLWFKAELSLNKLIVRFNEYDL
jgi:hypothetical protein